MAEAEAGTSNSEFDETHEERVRKDAKFFVKEFVWYFEDYCHEYYTRLKNGKYKCGKLGRRFIECMEIGKGVTEAIPEPFSKAAAVVLYSIIQKVVRNVSVKHNEQEVNNMRDKLYDVRDNPRIVRQMLVDTGMEIFQRYELIMEESRVDGDKVRALEFFAKDAVHRMISYLKENPNEELSVNTLRNGLIYGRSKTEFKVKIGNVELNNLKIQKQFGGILAELNKQINGDCFYTRVLNESVYEDVKNEILEYLEEYTRTDTERLQSIEKILNEDISELSEILEKNHTEIKQLLGIFDEKIDVVIEKLSRISPSVFKDAEESEDTLINVKEPVRKFTGRKKELEELHKIITKNQTTVIAGMSGVGKTELARKYSQEYGGKHHKKIFWIDAKDATTLDNSFKKVAQKHLKVPTTKESKEIDIKEIVKEVYKSTQTATGEHKILFVLDGVGNWKEIVDYMPMHPRRSDYVLPQVLITSNYTDWGDDVKILNLDVLTDKDAINLVRRGLADKFNIDTNIKNFLEFHEEIKKELEELSKEEMDDGNPTDDYLKKYRECAKNIVTTQQIDDLLNSVEDGFKKYYDLVKKLTETLGRIPLAIEQSIAYINFQRKNGKTYSIGKFLDDYNKILDSGKFRCITNNYEKTTYTAYTMTLDAMKRDKDESEYNKGKALEFLKIIGYFSSNNIPRDIFDKESEEAIDLLFKYSLITVDCDCDYDCDCDCDNGFFSIHRLFQDIIRSEIEGKEEEEEILRKALQMIKDDNTVSYTHVTSIWSFVGSKIDSYESLIDSCRSLIDEFVDPVHFEQTSTPLHFLSFYGYDNAVRLIVKHLKEGDPGKLQRVIKKTDSFKFTPLLQAVLGGHLNIVKTLLENDDSVEDETLNMCLHMAGSYGHVDIVEYLIEEKGIELNVQYTIDDNDQKSLPFHLAVFLYGHLKIVKYVLGQDRNVLTMTTEKGENCLHLSAASGQLDLFRYLVKELNLRDMLSLKANRHFKPVHYAAQNGHTNIVEYLINSGLTDDEDITNCLYLAAFYGHLSLLKYLCNFVVDDDYLFALIFLARFIKHRKVRYYIHDEIEYELRRRNSEFNDKRFENKCEDYAMRSPFLRHLLFVRNA